MLKKENDNLATNQLFIVVTFQSHKMMRGNEMNIFSSLHISKHTFTNKNNALIEQENDEEKCFLLFLTTSEVFVFLHLSLWLHLMVGGPPSPYLPFNLSKPFHEIKLRLSHKILHQVKGRLNFFVFYWWTIRPVMQ